MSGEWNAPIAMLQVHDGHLNVVFLVWRDRARTVAHLKMLHIHWKNVRTR